MINLSRKQMNLVILKSIIHFELDHIEINSNNFKSLSLNILKNTKFYSESLYKYINSITRSQFNSFKDRACKLINKYNYSKTHKPNLNSTSFEEMKQNVSIDYIKTEVIHILNDLRTMIQ